MCRNHWAADGAFFLFSESLSLFSGAESFLTWSCWEVSLAREQPEFCCRCYSPRWTSQGKHSAPSSGLSVLLALFSIVMHFHRLRVKEVQGHFQVEKMRKRRKANHPAARTIFVSLSEARGVNSSCFVHQVPTLSDSLRSESPKSSSSGTSSDPTYIFPQFAPGCYR